MKYDLLPVIDVIELDRSHSHTKGESSNDGKEKRKSGRDPQHNLLKTNSIEWSFYFVVNFPPYISQIPIHNFEYSWYHVTSYLHSRDRITQTCFQGTISKIVFYFPKGEIQLDFPEPFEYHRPIHYTNNWYSVSMTGIVGESFDLIYNFIIIALF